MILKRFSIFTFVVSLALSAAAQTGREWQDPNVNAVNREPVHTFFPDYAPSRIVEVLPGGDRIETSSEWVKSLNGLWKFNWVRDLDQRPTTFFAEDFDDAGWVDFPVPAVWELNGYGDPVYTNIPYAWSRNGTTMSALTAARSSCRKRGTAARSFSIWDRPLRTFICG